MSDEDAGIRPLRFDGADDEVDFRLGHFSIGLVVDAGRLAPRVLVSDHAEEHADPAVTRPDGREQGGEFMAVRAPRVPCQNSGIRGIWPWPN